MADDIQLEISAEGAGQVDQEFSEIEKSAERAQGTLNNFGSLGGFDSFLGRVREAKGELGNVRDYIDGVAGAGQKMALVGGGALAVMGAGLKESLQSFGAMQQVEGGFESFLGSPEAAKAMIKDVSDFARDSPFDFAQSAKSVQQLLAMGFTAEQIIPTLKSVGNAVSAAGGDTETFQGVLTALGQIKTKGKLSQEELNQIQERGLGVGFLAEKLGLTAAQMGEVGNQGVDANKAISALLEGFGSIGNGNAMARQMETIPGQVSTLGDSFNQLEASIGKVFSADASGLVSNLTTLLDKTKGFVDQNPDLVRTAATIAGIAAGGLVVGGGALMIGGGIARGAMDIAALAKAMKGGKLAAQEAAKAKDGLVTSTLKDIAAEAEKTKVAGKEAGALGEVADAAKDAAAAKDGLTGATEAATEKMGLLARAKALLGGKLLPEATRNALFDESGIMPKFGKASFALNNATVGTGLASAALGAAAGYEFSNAGKAAGMSDTSANLLGGAGGLAVSALTIMAPEAILPVAAAVAIGEALKYGIDKLYNEPAEKKAETGSGADDKETYGDGMAAQQAKAQKAANTGTKAGYLEMAEHMAEMSSKAGMAGDDDSRMSYNAQSRTYRNLAKKAGTPGTVEYDVESARRSFQMQHDVGFDKRDVEARVTEFRASRQAQEDAAPGAGQRVAKMPQPTVNTEQSGDVSVEVRVVRKDTRYERDAGQYAATRRTG